MIDLNYLMSVLCFLVQLDIDNWADGNPDYPPSGEACVAAKAQDSMEGQWDDMGCTTTKPYICEKPKGICQFTLL